MGIDDPPNASARTRAVSSASQNPTPPATIKPPPKKPPPKSTNKGPASPCHICQANVAKGKPGVQCDQCLSWVHSDCLKMSSETYDFISKCQNFHYLCDKCHGDTVIVAPKPVATKLTALEEKVDTLTTKMNSLLGIPSDNNQGANATNASVPAPLSYAAATAKKLQEMPAKIIQDLRAMDQTERMRRCIVVSGLSEEGADYDDAKRLIHSLDKSVDVKEVFRMGTLDRKDQEGRPTQRTPQPRLLKVVLRSSGVARSVLSRAYLLRNSEDFPNVFLRRSMTKEERTREYNYRQKRNNMNAANDPRVTGMLYIVTNGSLKRIIGCSVDDEGNVTGGRIDRDWAPAPDNTDGMSVVTVDGGNHDGSQENE